MIRLRDCRVTAFLAMTFIITRLPRRFAPRMYESTAFVNDMRKQEIAASLRSSQ
jgi:hypothetical protein